MTYDNYSTPSCSAESSASYVPYNRRLVHGVGLNDYPSSTKVNKRNIKSYETWCDMLRRCYSSKCHAVRSTYIGCSVAVEWHSFTAFEKWFTENHFEGAALDKDILIPGNKVYGPDTCVFVSAGFNSLLTTHAAARGSYPLGVTKTKVGRFQSKVNSGSSSVHLGTFDTPLEAHQAWQRAKLQIIADFYTTDPRIRKALDLRVAQLRDDLLHNRITEKL